MVECDGCPDKLRCTTGQKSSCDRGFKLKMCCRKHLSGKKEEIIKMLINVPNEMIDGSFVTYRDICPMCDDKIVIRLQMANSCNDEIAQLQSELDSLRRIVEMDKMDKIVAPNPYPYPYPGLPPGQPYIGDAPNNGGVWSGSTTGKAEADMPSEKNFSLTFENDEEFYKNAEQDKLRLSANVRSMQTCSR